MHAGIHVPVDTATKGKKCWYCGKTLKKDQITMDHLYPQDLGGPTIPNNLAPACKECNNDKSNLTEKQYRMLRKYTGRKKGEMRERFLDENEERRYRSGYFLPIVVDRNNYLLDGFLILMFAKNHNISKVPTIILENIEVVVNK